MDVHTLSRVLEHLPFAEWNTEAEEFQSVPWGAPNKEKNSGKETEVKAASAPAPGQQLFVRCLHSAGPGETWAIKNKSLLSIHSIPRA